MNNTNVGIKNVPFAIKRFIKDAPYYEMWLREPLKNCIEATRDYIAVNDIKKPAKIKIRALRVNGLFEDYETTNYKLSFLNYKGMTGAELRTATELFSSVDKTQSDHDNFGVGEKVVLANFTDILKISYKNKKAHYTYLGMYQDQFIRINDVQECTEWVQEQAEYRGYDMDHDWTETIIMGKDPKVNTFLHTFGAEKTQPNRNHIIHKAFTRFFDMPPGIQIVFENGESNDSTVHGAGKESRTHGLTFETREQKWEKALKKNSNCFSIPVNAQDSNTYIYYYDAPNEAGNPELQGTSSSHGDPNFVSLIWGKHNDKERYDVLSGDKWKRVASQLGLYVDHKHFKVDVILPYDRYETTTYRNAIKSKNAESDDAICYKDFIQGIRDNMPAKWAEKIKEHNQKAHHSNIEDRIKDRLTDFHIKEPINTTPINTGPAVLFGQGSISNGKGTGRSGNSKGGKGKGGNAGGVKGPKPKTFGSVAPMVPTFVEDIGIKGFAQYTPEGLDGKDVVYYNPEHQYVNKLFNKVEDIVDECIWGDVRKEAIDLINTELGVKICIAQAQLQTDWFDRETFAAITTDTALTFDVLQRLDSLVDPLRKFAKEKQKEYENTGFLNIQQKEWEAAGVKLPTGELV
jgi:hypothetical protein